MVTSGSSSDYSSISPEEDFKPSTIKTRAKENRDIPVDNQRVTYAELRKRKAEDDELEDSLRRRARIERRIAKAEDKLHASAEGVDSNSDVSEDESMWGPPEREIKPDRYTREIEKPTRADPEAEREEEAGWDTYEEYIHPDIVNGPDSDSDEEREEDSAEDDDDGPDDSDKSNASDESD
ncbi:glutamic acid-rich protein-like [Papaver somniferum]|uniref:glutamic acid-rich protein-like n=1 Tax=Papaver somniferum TaxID=3469 RepID=UPI000E6F97B6|nr:glutamic acid-rich protein-like [Papaver somniferum]